MDDGVRPSQIEFDRVLRKSYEEWSSNSKTANSTSLLPYHCIDLTSLLGRSPSFLGHGLMSDNKTFSFACEERESQGKYGLLVKGHSIWSTSNGTCNTEPKTIPSQSLLLAISDPLKVLFSENSPLAEWPGVEGVSTKGRDNYIAVLFLAWAYILSAQWVELLGRSPAHACRQRYTEATPGHTLAGFDIGYETSEVEARWWEAVLSFGWDATTYYNGRTYLSPWSVASKKQSLGGKGTFHAGSPEPPSSRDALEYIARFCEFHGLYDQCFAALAAVLYIPSLNDGEISLQIPKDLAMRRNPVDTLTVSHSDIFAKYSNNLPRYMTLSSNVFGMRSLLSSTFFNVGIECNLVSAWMGPIFATIDPLIKDDNFARLAIILGNRQPKLAALWLGAIIVGTAPSVIRGAGIGMTALDLHAAAWTTTMQSFISVSPGQADDNDENSILRADECRLLFILGCEGHTRPPISPWKPFGRTRVADTELAVRRHAECGCHCLEYLSWHWESSDGNNTLEDAGLSLIPGEKLGKELAQHTSFESAPCLFKPSELLSEVATRSIFSWLRSNGYPASENFVYQHSWVDIGSSDGEEIDDEDSSNDEQRRDGLVEEWIMNTDWTMST